MIVIFQFNKKFSSRKLLNLKKCFQSVYKSKYQLNYTRLQHLQFMFVLGVKATRLTFERALFGAVMAHLAYLRSQLFRLHERSTYIKNRLFPRSCLQLSQNNNKNKYHCFLLCYFSFFVCRISSSLAFLFFCHELLNNIYILGLGFVSLYSVNKQNVEGKHYVQMRLNALYFLSQYNLELDNFSERSFLQLFYMFDKVNISLK